MNYFLWAIAIATILFIAKITSRKERSRIHHIKLYKPIRTKEQKKLYDDY
jgi:hypothetical protein